MSLPFRLLLPALALFAGLAEEANAQRGGGRGRGPSEAILGRSGSYFADVELPAPDPEDKDRIPLESASLVRTASEAGHLSVLYLFDPQRDERKHEQFEQTIFGHADVSAALRCFQCGRVDLTKDEAAMAEFGKHAPLFVAFDAEGNRAGEVSLRDYRAKASPIVKLLEKAARGHAKLPLKEFVKRYRAFLNDYRVWEGRMRVLRDRRQRLREKDPAPKADLAALDQEENELKDSEQELLEGEKQLLELAGVPPRPANAQRLGDRRRGGRR